MTSKRSRFLIASLVAVPIICLSVALIFRSRVLRIDGTREPEGIYYHRLAVKIPEITKEPKEPPRPEPRHGDSPRQTQFTIQSPGRDPSALKGEGEAPASGDDEFQENLSWIIDKEFPELHLSDEELVALSESLKTIRASLQAARLLKRTAANTETIKRHRENLDQALQAFDEITGMNPGQFMRRAGAGGGIDNEKPDDEEIVTEYLRDSVH